MNHPTFPLIPVVTERNKDHFMQVRSKPFTRELEVEGVRVITAPLPFDQPLNLLALSHSQELIELGFQDDTDTLAPHASVAAVYLAHSTKSVLKATILKSDSGLEVFKPPKAYPNERLLRVRGNLRFALQLENDEALEFDLWMTGHIHTHTGMSMMGTDGKFVVVRQSPWCVREQPLSAYQARGFELDATRINYNRRLRAA